MNVIDKEQQAKDILCFLANKCGYTFENSFVEENRHDFCASVYTLPMYDKMYSMMLCSKSDVLSGMIDICRPKIVVFRPSYADYLEECLLAAREDDIIVTRYVFTTKYYAYMRKFDKLFMHKDTTLEQILIDMDLNTPVARAF